VEIAGGEWTAQRAHRIFKDHCQFPRTTMDAAIRSNWKTIGTAQIRGRRANRF
jgi:hypothetical protein